METVIEGKTGVFFDEQNEDSLIEAVNRFENMSFDSKIIVKNTHRFGKSEERGFRQRDCESWHHSRTRCYQLV